MPQGAGSRTFTHVNVIRSKHKVVPTATGGLFLAVLLACAPTAAAADTTLTAEAGSIAAPDCDQEKCIALTFDDGPGPYTDDLLDILAGHDAEATFYLLGSNVEKFPDTVERMADQGHEIGTHTWKHDDLTTLSGADIEDDLERTDKAVEDITGERPATVRPPYGSLDDTVRGAVDRPIVLWDVDTLDWQSRDAGAVTGITMEGAGRGGIVLFHDIHESTVEAVPGILDGLAGEGYRFVTVSQLAGDDLEPGTAITGTR